MAEKATQDMLFLVERHDAGDYDTFSEFLVCCATEAEARDTHPSGDCRRNHTWIKREEIHLLNVTCIGVALSGVERGVLLASFHAG